MNNIFTHFISRNSEDDDKRIGYILWFDETFPDTEFQGEDFIMKKFCYYCGRLTVPMKLKYLQVFMSTELKPLLLETHVRVPGTDNIIYDDPAGLQTAYQIMVEYLTNEFKQLESYESDVRDFRVLADEFITNKLKDRVVDELGRSFNMLNETEDSNEAVTYVLDNFVLLQEIYDKSCLEEIDEHLNDDKDYIFVSDTGIPVIDADITGIFTSQVISIAAAAGVGKTRMAVGVWAYRAAVVYHKNVVYYMLEGSRREIESMFIARHVFTLYNIFITSKMILEKQIPDEYVSMVSAAKIDLFESGKYGKIHIVVTNLYVDTLVQTYRKDDMLHGSFDMVIVDYMGLLKQGTTKYGRVRAEYEVIVEGYRKTKNYVSNTNKCAILVGQFNDKGVDAGELDKQIQPNMIQGGLGVTRHIDSSLDLSRTPQMKAQNKLRVTQTKTRSSSGFGSAIIDARQDICYYFQRVSQEI